MYYHFSQKRVLSFLPNPPDSGVEAESWIIVAKNVRIMNLCFKNLGIMNLCPSARESWITRLWEKLNKMHVSINCVRSGRECKIWRFRESNFQTFFRGNMPPYIIRAFGADSPLVSPVTLVLNVQFLHTWTKRMITSSMDENRTADRSLNTKETIQNEIKLPLRLNNFNRWSKVFVNRESGRKVW